MIVRIALPEDAADIADVAVQSWQQAYRGLLPQDFLDSLDPSQRAISLRHAIETQDPPADASLVVADRSDILGFARISPTRDEDKVRTRVGELVSIYLRPDTWGQGLGKRLLGHAVGLLRDAGNTDATLWVLQDNSRAIAFYEANGWTLDGAFKHATIADTVVIEVRYRIAL